MTNKNRNERIRLKSGVVIIEHKNGISLGHIDKRVTLSHAQARIVIRELHNWVSFEDLLALQLSNSDSELIAIFEIISTLDQIQLIERKYVETIPVEYFISHLNEVGICLAALLVHHGISVRSLENRVIGFSDVRGHFIRLTDAGLSANEVLDAQRREIINGGNREDSLQSDSEGIKPRKIVIITAYPEPELLAQLMSDGIEYIVAITTLFGAHIGPFVTPGRTPCFHCIELHRSDLDENWQKMATALFLQRDERVSMESAYFTSALLGRLLLRIARGEIPHEVIANTLTISCVDLEGSSFPTDSGAESHQWNFHPHCTCHWGSALSTRVG